MTYPFIQAIARACRYVSAAFSARRLRLTCGLAAVLMGGYGCGSRPAPPASAISANRDAAAINAPPAAPLFDDVLPASGIDFATKQTHSPLTILETMGHGAGLIDVDGDGLLDIVLAGPDKIHLYRNLGNYRFQDITAGSGLKQAGYWQGVAVGDYDNDGRPDLYVCGYNCSALYHNEGGGKFRDVTAQAGLSARKPGADGIGDWRTSAAFADLDGDGKPDLYVCRYLEFGPHTPQLCSHIGKTEKYSCPPDTYTPQHGSLYRNLGGGRFADVTRASGLQNSGGRALGVAFADLEGHGKPSIAIANDERPGDLYFNKGGMKFANQGEMSGTAYSAEGHVHGGMGADWADVDGDGKLDMFVSTYEKETKSLYRNLGQGLFSEASLQMGLGDSLRPWVSFGCKFLDYDNDGWPDLMTASGHVLDNTAVVYPGTQFRQPTQLFHNNRGVFAEVTDQMSVSARRLMVGRGLAVGDLNNSGHLDAIVTDLDGPPLLLRNRSQDTNHWLTLKLVGTRSNRDGVGARITVEAGGRTQLLQATNGGSFLSASDPRVHIGLGAAKQIDRLRIHWPSGHEDTFTNVTPDQFFRATEGSKQLAKTP